VSLLRPIALLIRLPAFRNKRPEALKRPFFRDGKMEAATLGPLRGDLNEAAAAQLSYYPPSVAERVQDPGDFSAFVDHIRRMGSNSTAEQLKATLLRPSRHSPTRALALSRNRQESLMYFRSMSELLWRVWRMMETSCTPFIAA
jgi:hypothetical protein